jgi:hypothetical protein
MLAENEFSIEEEEVDEENEEKVRKTFTLCNFTVFEVNRCSYLSLLTAIR